jgi:hypothetical protein
MEVPTLLRLQRRKRCKLPYTIKQTMMMTRNRDEGKFLPKPSKR